MRNDRANRVRPRQEYVTLQDAVLVTILLYADACLFIDVKARPLHGVAKPVPCPVFRRDGNGAAGLFNNAQDTAVYVECKAVLQERLFKLTGEHQVFGSPRMRDTIAIEQPNLVRVSKSQLQIMGTHQHGELTNARYVT